jgi:hypothetical protein
MHDSYKAASWPALSDDQLAKLIDGWTRYSRPETGSHYDEIMLEIQERVDTTGSLGKADIGALLLWKRLNLNTKWSRALNDMSDSMVRGITKAAIFEARRTDLPIPQAAQAARVALLALPGCSHGHAVPSTLLVAGAPDRMAVYDRRALNALHLLGFRRPKTYSEYMQTVVGLVVAVASAGHEWTPRDVDRALFMMGG